MPYHRQPLQPHVLVTAGPTREHLDDVRFLSNGSTGRMGYSVAEAARAVGCPVTLVTGPTALLPPAGVRVIPVVSALDMLAACQQILPTCDVVFAVAAVADHRPRLRQEGKPAKSERYTLELVANPDIVATLAREPGSRVIVGFALDAAGDDVGQQRARAQAKLVRKGLDLIVRNDTSALGHAASAVEVLDASGVVHTLPAQDKAITARWLVDLALQRWRQSGRA
jgi:phosphopantothenoylcysteine decarboxylase/phosphopantothenate--cysteine ligase